MKWVGEWWGIIITAEDKEDEEMLEQLKKKLPKQAEDFCDFGNIVDHTTKNYWWYEDEYYVDTEKVQLIIRR